MVPADQAVQKIQPPASAGYEGLLFPPEQSAKIQKPKSLKASVNSNSNFPIFWRITPKGQREGSHAKAPRLSAAEPQPNPSGKHRAAEIVVGVYEKNNHCSDRCSH
jgi:hypothetical protein